MSKVLFIGPRIQDLGGFTKNDMQTSIMESINAAIVANKSSIILTGLNLGIETWAAQSAYENGVTYHVYVPFKNPESKWPQSSQNVYNNLLKAAKKVVTLDNGEFAVAKLSKKEEKMIEDADIIYSAYPDTCNKLSKLALEHKKQIVLLLELNKVNSTESGFYIEI